MTLIKCSECGKEVSDKAEACPKCGNPIAIKPVELRFISQFMIDRKCRVYDAESGEELWQGKQGEVAVINTNNEVRDLALEIEGRGRGIRRVKPGERLLVRAGFVGIEWANLDDPQNHDGGSVSIGFGKLW